VLPVSPVPSPAPTPTPAPTPVPPSSALWTKSQVLGAIERAAKAALGGFAGTFVAQDLVPKSAHSLAAAGIIAGVAAGVAFFTTLAQSLPD
jgi:hypothetical protein